MCETSKMPTRSRTARCSSRMPEYWTGISQPPKSISFAPSSRWRSYSGVRFSVVARAGADMRRKLAQAGKPETETEDDDPVEPAPLSRSDRETGRGLVPRRHDPRRRPPRHGAPGCLSSGVPAISGSESRGPPNAAGQVREEERFGVALARVTAGGVESTPAGELLAPGDRVVGSHRAARIGSLVDRRQDVDASPRIRAEVVPLVVARPVFRQRGGRRV